MYLEDEGTLEKYHKTNLSENRDNGFVIESKSKTLSHFTQGNKLPQ